MAKLKRYIVAEALTLAPASKTITPEQFEQLLYHSYLIASEAETKLAFFKQEDTKISSTLILLDLIENFNHPVAQARHKCPKKGRPANNLLCLLADSSWNQDIIKGEDGAKYKAFPDWGAHAVHVSDLICFRNSYKEKYSYSKFSLICYDIEESIRGHEYQWQKS